MGRLILVTGANGSGKSAYAEQLIGSMSGPRLYIATMIPQTDENKRRIKRHRERRADMGFTTIECPGSIRGVPVSPDAVVLLEDVSNFCANLIFEERADEAEILRQIEALRETCACLVAVTIEGFDESDYSGETADYIRTLKRVNASLEAVADGVISMRDGAPRMKKSEGCRDGQRI